MGMDMDTGGVILRMDLYLYLPLTLAKYRNKTTIIIRAPHMY